MNKCKKLGNRATIAERSEAHRAKMEMKVLKNEHNRQEMLRDPQYVFANLSRNHEFYGDTPTEHEARKFAEKSS